MKALDWLLQAIHRGTLFDRFSRRRKGNKPGDVILSMPQEAREELSKLTSEELEKVRPKDYEMMGWDPKDTVPSETVHQLLSDFDKKIIK